MCKLAIPTACLLAVLGMGRCCVAQSTEPSAPNGDVQINHDAERFLTKVRIRARNGRVAWSDVIRGLARARGNDDSALEGMLPPGGFDVRGIQWELIQTGMNLAFQPHVRFDVEPPRAETGDPHLVVQLDREAILVSTRRFKALFRNAWLRWRPGRGQQYGLEGPDGWDRVAPRQNLVVFVHGFNSRPESMEALITATREKGFACAGFRYPNDQPIVDSAELLAGELARLAADHPGRGVSLVTHSMGGLVAREAVENPESDPGNVRKLIMVSPPSQGTALARFSFALEVWEQVREVARREDAGVFYATVEDGLSEAGEDLRPGSPFLNKLNARPRNPKVAYSIFLGTKGPLSEQDLKQLRQEVADANQKNRWVRFFGTQVHGWLEDLDEVVEGKGDGVVSVRRGKLEGVDDTVIGHFGHLGVLDPAAGDEEEKVHEGILERLRKSP